MLTEHWDATDVFLDGLTAEQVLKLDNAITDAWWVLKPKYGSL